MRASAIVLGACALAVAASGCLVVNDASEHTRPPEGVDAGASDGGGPDGGGPDDGGADAGPSVADTEYCRTLGELWCGAVGPCCETVGAAPAGCVETFVDSCEDRLGAVFTDERIAYDGRAAAEALGEARALASMCDTDIQEWLTRRDGFFRPFEGSVGGGMECEFLATGPAAFAQAFVLCESETQSCREDGDGVRRCFERGRPGDACVYHTECEDGMRCVRDRLDRLEGGTCATMGEDENSECRLDSECQSLTCRGAGNLGLTSGSCEPATRNNVYCP